MRDRVAGWDWLAGVGTARASGKRLVAAQGMVSQASVFETQVFAWDVHGVFQGVDSRLDDEKAGS